MTKVKLKVLGEKNIGQFLHQLDPELRKKHNL